MDTGSGDKSNADNDLYLPQTDSFWEVKDKKQNEQLHFDFCLSLFLD